MSKELFEVPCCEQGFLGGWGAGRVGYMQEGLIGKVNDVFHLLHGSPFRLTLTQGTWASTLLTSVLATLP